MAADQGAPAPAVATSKPIETPRIEQVPLIGMVPYSRQARKHFDPAALAALADSIKRDGVVQPIIIRHRKPGAGGCPYEIIAGERRYRASKLAGLSTIPAIVRDLTDEQAQVIHLIENFQRADLTLIEECGGCAALVEALTAELAAKPDEKKRSALDIAAERLNKSKAWVSRRVGMSKLPEPIVDLVKSGKLTSVDIAHGLAELAEIDSDTADGLLERIEHPEWNEPVTREELQNNIKESRAWLKREQEAEKAREKEQQERARKEAAQAAAAKTPAKPGAAGADKAQPAVTVISKEEAEKARIEGIRSDMRKFARAQRAAILAVLTGGGAKTLDKHFTFSIGEPPTFDPSHFQAYSTKVPKSAETAEYRVEMRGPTDQAGRILEVLKPKHELQLGLRVTVEQLRKIEEIVGPQGIQHIEVAVVSADKLFGAAAAMRSNSAAAKLDNAQANAAKVIAAKKPAAKAAPKPAAKKAAAKKAPAKAAPKKK